MQGENLLSYGCIRNENGPVVLCVSERGFAAASLTLGHEFNPVSGGLA